MKILAKIYSIVKVHNILRVLLEILKKMCALLEHYKSNQINPVIQYSAAVFHRIKANIIAILVQIGGVVHYY